MEQLLDNLMRFIVTSLDIEIIQGKNEWELRDKGNKFLHKNGKQWRTLRQPLTLQDGSLIMILVKWDIDDGRVPT